MAHIIEQVNPEDAKISHVEVPTKKRFLWGIGGFADCMMYNGINGLVDPIYNMGMGIDGRIIGLARSIPRFADMIIDPLIGHLSDNTRSRWGRRRPWMLVGALIASVIAMVMWMVPWSSPAALAAHGHGVQNIYVVAMMVLLFTFGYSLFVIPYVGQGYELTTDYNERTHIFQWRQYAFAVAGFVTPWLPWLCIKLDIVFYGVPKAAANGLHGIMWVGILAGILILATALCPIMFGGVGGAAHQGESKVPFFQALMFTLKNSAFWPLVLGNFLMKFCGVITGIFFMYLLIYHVAQGDKQAGTEQWGIFCNVINIATFIAMAPVVKMTDKIGKKPALLFLMMASAAVYASVYFTFQPTTGWSADVASWLFKTLSIPLTIGRAWPIYVSAAGIGIFCNCMPMIVNSMLADVCDVDEVKSGHQRQAFYGAVFVTTDKIAMGVAMLCQGFLLEASGFKSGQFVGDPAVCISYWMKALLFTQPVGFILGFCCVLAYPITHARAIETRRLLDARKKQ